MCRYGACISERKICDGWKQCADGSDETAELCLITRAKMQQAWEKAELLDRDVYESNYKPITPMLSLTRRPTTTVKPLLRRRPTTPTTTAAPPFPPTPNVGGDDILIKGLKKVTKGCSLPEIPTNAEASISSCRSNPDADYCKSNITIVPFGVQIQFTCSPGYALNGAAAIVCKESSTWSSMLPSCDASKNPHSTFLSAQVNCVI